MPSQSANTTLMPN